MIRRVKQKEVINSLARHKDITDEFLTQIKNIPKDILENLGTDLAKKAVAMSREVNGELHSFKAFLRLSVSAHGILYTKLERMKHSNEKPLLQFFKKRFPEFIILFESDRGVFTIDQNSLLVTKRSLEDVVKEIEEKLPKNPLLNDLNGKNYQDLWESFAQSQLIPERKTSRQILNLSKKWRRAVAVDKVTARSLEEFFK